MRKAVALMLVAIMAFLVVSTGCSSGKDEKSAQETTAPGKTEGTATTNNEQQDAPKSSDGKTEPQAEKKELSGEITVWGETEFMGEIAKAFNAKHPNVKVNIEWPEDSDDKLLTALAAGTGAPDVAWVGEYYFGRFLNIDGLEDLSQPPYSANEKYKSDFTKLFWDIVTAMDGKKIIAMPMAMNPFVTFYRKDIMEENGYPGEPEEVGKLIADPDKFFEMAQKLRANGHYFFRWATEPMEVGYNGAGFYDRDLNFIRNNDDFLKSIDFAKKAYQLDLVLDLSREERTQAFRSGKFVMYHQASSALNTIQEFKEGNQGVWRMTTLPFGQFPANGFNAMMLPSQSKNKEAAWAFIEFATTDPGVALTMMKGGNVPAYKPSANVPEIKDLKADVLDGQNISALLFPLLDKLNFRIGTPFEEDALDYWDDRAEDVIVKNLDARAFVKTLMDEIEKKFEPEKQKIRKQLGK